MQDDLERNFPSSDITILGVNENGQHSANDVITADSDVPWLQDVDANANGLSDVVQEAWAIDFRDVLILDRDNSVPDEVNNKPLGMISRCEI